MIEIVSAPDTERKLSILGTQSSFDLCAPPSLEGFGGRLPGIYYAWSRGCRVPLLKVLYANQCTRGCRYCAFSTSVDNPRVKFEIDELVRLFLDLNEKGAVRGLFLSSAIPGCPDDIMEEMIAVAQRLRRKEFSGYIHLKILPGTHPDLAKKARMVASRVSINFEVPREDKLRLIAPRKSIRREILPLLPIIKGSFTTQFVVGPAGEKDIELLEAVQWLKKRYKLRRAYFKAFEPIPGTPLGHNPPGSRRRQLRLYQAEHLVRCYGFSAHGLVGRDGNLDLEIEPKTLWAMRNPQFFPLELEKAGYSQLLRVPGIGPRIASSIIKVRRESTLTPDGLKKMGLNLRKSAPYLVLRGRLLETIL